MIRDQQESEYHKSVLVQEVIEGLQIKSGKKYIDATLGGGGHTFEILKRGGIVLGIDIDDDSIIYVRNKLKAQISKVKLGRDIFLAQGNFADLKKIATSQKFSQVSGILFDLGVSSHQLETKERGFSFRFDAPLDMRMDKKGNITAENIVNRASKEELYEIFTKYAEEIDSRAILEAIIRARALKPIRTTDQLAQVIISVKGRAGRTHPATQLFQALRITVNHELENLKRGLDDAGQLLEIGGRLAVISFHSLEDRIVKFHFRDKNLRELFNKPIRPTLTEIRQNPRSAGAKLRIFEKYESLDKISL